MKTPQNLLSRLGVINYTKRHERIIKDFIASGSKDAKKLLNQLGNWDKLDLKITEDFINKK